MTSLADLLRARAHLADIEPASHPGFEAGDGSDKAAGEAALAALGAQISDLQERLFANGRAATSTAKVLLVVQGMDTSGKGGILRHVAGLVDPQGLQLASFKQPTPQELEHDFLWRIEKQLPHAGMIGIFDRSHYEDVLVCRVRELAPPEEIERRYGAIVDFERDFVESGGRIIKVMLHISRSEQKQRLLGRLADPSKYWKYRPGDVEERMLWDEYQKAYGIAIERCDRDGAPWYVVPADQKWYARWAVATLLADTLRSLALDWPPADFDVAAERGRVEAS